MALRSLEHFNVQPLLDDGTIDKTRSISIEATSALRAGEAALGRPLALEGKSARAVVWRLTEAFVALSVRGDDRQVRAPQQEAIVPVRHTDARKLGLSLHSVLHNAAQCGDTQRAPHKIVLGEKHQRYALSPAETKTSQLRALVNGARAPFRV